MDSDPEKKPKEEGKFCLIEERNEENSWLPKRKTK